MYSIATKASIQIVLNYIYHKGICTQTVRKTLFLICKLHIRIVIFETFNTHTYSLFENYQTVPLCVTNRIIYNGRD